MENEKRNISLRKLSIIAGVSLLLMAITGGFSYGYVISNLIIPHDALGTANKIIESPVLFRIGIFGFLITLVLDVIVAWALYLFFKSSNKHVSLLTAWLRLIYSAFLGIAILNLVFIVLLLKGEAYLKAFEINQVYSLVMISAGAFNDIWSIGLIIFGLHLVSLGYLALKAFNIPRIFGILLLFAGFCYLAANISNLLLLNYAEYKKTVEMFLSLPMAVGELSFAFWLLVRGGKAKFIKAIE